MKTPVVAVSGLLLIITSSSGAGAASLYTRNLSCRQWPAARANEICKSLEREMEWTWTGHAIVAPSYRVTFETVRRTYCVLSISKQDTPTLVDMMLVLERKPDSSMAWAQMANGARFLLHLLGKQALDAFPLRDKSWDDQMWQIVKNLREEITLNSSDPGMIWNPANPQYLLRNGCR
jgi:hypothetical protein